MVCDFRYYKPGTSEKRVQWVTLLPCGSLLPPRGCGYPFLPTAPRPFQRDSRLEGAANQCPSHHGGGKELISDPSEQK